MSTCGSHHAGDWVSYLLYDINWIPFARVCDKCRHRVQGGQRHWTIQHAEAIERSRRLVIFNPSV